MKLHVNQSLTTTQLGYPPDARLLILNADDFGLCNASNEAILAALLAGPIRSTTLMVPCPWSYQAMRFLAAHPELPFGVHLTVMSDPDAYRWGPVSSRERVPSLVDERGCFYNFDAIHAHLPGIPLAELELEFRAQIENVLSAGLRPTHLDWHALRFGNRTDIPQLMTRLALEYGLAQRVIGRDWIEALRGQGLPCIDYDFLDSYGIPPAEKPARYAQLLHELPAGLSEWAIHPALDSAELLALEPGGNHVRQADFDFWTSPQAKEIIAREGILLTDYRALQPFWQAAKLKR